MCVYMCACVSSVFVFVCVCLLGLLGYASGTFHLLIVADVRNGKDNSVSRKVFVVFFEIFFCYSVFLEFKNRQNFFVCFHIFVFCMCTSRSLLALSVRVSSQCFVCVCVVASVGVCSWAGA